MAKSLDEPTWVIDELEQILEDEIGEFIRYRTDFAVGIPKKGLKGR